MGDPILSNLWHALRRSSGEMSSMPRARFTLQKDSGRVIVPPHSCRVRKIAIIYFYFCAFQCRPLMVHAKPKLFLRPISQRKLHWFQMWIWLPDRSLQETINKISVWLSKWVTYNESNIPILSTPPHHPLFRLSFALGVQWCSSKVSPFLSPGPSACSCLQKP